MNSEGKEERVKELGADLAEWRQEGGRGETWALGSLGEWRVELREPAQGPVE